MRSWRALRGFSLVEVTIAMGIFAFALISLVGLMPTALSSARESLDLATAAQLAAGEAAKLHQIGYANLPSSPTVDFFDDIGAPLDTADGAIYRVDTVVGPSESNSLKRVAITVSRPTNAAFRQRFCYLVFKRE